MSTVAILLHLLQNKGLLLAYRHGYRASPTLLLTTQPEQISIVVIHVLWNLALRVIHEVVGPCFSFLSRTLCLTVI